jgi:hypothetical protein
VIWCTFVEALSGTAALSVETRALIRSQKRLFESFLQLLAHAIDAKSRYTGGHCARVPVLTKMLARAACDATSGPFRDFALGDDGWETLHVAAWLHDCGKVTTPEFIVDKATKLETLYDRIHEIRMRFEVLKRDATIACCEAIIAGEARAGPRPAGGRTGRAGRRVRLRGGLQRGRRGDGAGRRGAPAADRRRAGCAPSTTASACRPKSCAARARPSPAGGGGAARRQARASLRAPGGRPHRPRQPLGPAHGGAGAARQPGRARQPGDRPRHAHRRGPLPHQRAHC